MLFTIPPLQLLKICDLKIYVRLLEINVEYKINNDFLKLYVISYVPKFEMGSKIMTVKMK